MKWMDEMVEGDRHGDHKTFHEENERMQLDKRMPMEKTMQLAEKIRKRRTTCRRKKIPAHSGRLVFNTMSEEKLINLCYGKSSECLQNFLKQMKTV